MPPAAVIGGGAVLGGIAGAIGDEKRSNTVSGMNLSAAGALENQASGTQGYSLEELQKLTKAGANVGDVSAAAKSQRELAALYGQLSQTGGIPGQEDIATAQGFAKNIFQNQQEALNQSFVQQNTEANRLAAQLGRSIDDPILQAKLRTGFMNQQAQLAAEQGSYASQLALSLPQQRLQYATGQSDVLGNLATQAFQNRAALLSAGSNVLSSERNFRMGTAQQYSNNVQQSGGGVGGFITGAMGGAGALAGSAGAISNMFSGGGGGVNPYGSRSTVLASNPFSGASMSSSRTSMFA